MGLVYGVILGAVVISIGIIRYRTGMILRGDQTLSFVYWEIFAMSIFYAVFRFKKLEPLLFSFNRTITIGLLAGLLSGAMYTFYIVILNNYIDTELSSKIIVLNKEFVRSNPELPDKEVFDSLKFARMSSAVRGLIYTLVCITFGIAYSLISTVVAKKIDNFNMAD